MRAFEIYGAPTRHKVIAASPFNRRSHHASGIDTELTQCQVGQIYNVAVGSERENMTLAQRLIEFLGRGAEYIRLIPDRPGHDFRYSIVAEKLKSLD